MCKHLFFLEQFRAGNQSHVLSPGRYGLGPGGTEPLWTRTDTSPERANTANANKANANPANLANANQANSNQANANLANTADANPANMANANEAYTANADPANKANANMANTSGANTTAWYSTGVIVFLILADVGIDLRKPDQTSVDHTSADRIHLN